MIDQQIRTQLTIRIMLRVGVRGSRSTCASVVVTPHVSVFGRSRLISPAGSGWSVSLLIPSRFEAEPISSPMTSIANHAARTAHLAWPHDAVFGPATELPEAS